MERLVVMSMWRRSKAVTIAELIITTMIVTIIMAGVFGADLALRRMDKQVSGDTQVTLQTMALAEAIRSSVRSVHGDLAGDGNGIDINAGTNSICFRFDVSNTPNDFLDDEWDCYTQIGTKFYRCVKNPSDGPGACASTDKFVGSAVSDQFTNAATPITIYTDSTTGTYLFEMTLVNRLDPTAGAAVNPKGTLDNPQVIINIKESPAGF